MGNEKPDEQQPQKSHTSTNKTIKEMAKSTEDLTKLKVNMEPLQRISLLGKSVSRERLLTEENYGLKQKLDALETELEKMREKMTQIITNQQQQKSCATTTITQKTSAATTSVENEIFTTQNRFNVLEQIQNQEEKDTDMEEEEEEGTPFTIVKKLVKNKNKNTTAQQTYKTKRSSADTRTNKNENTKTNTTTTTTTTKDIVGKKILDLHQYIFINNY